MYDRNNFGFPPENKALDIAYYLSHHAWQELHIYIFKYDFPLS